jgi:hypothetical protein
MTIGLLCGAVAVLPRTLNRPHTKIGDKTHACLPFFAVPPSRKAVLRRTLYTVYQSKTLAGPHSVVLTRRRPRQRTSFVATGLILVSLLTALPALAATVGTLPAEQTQGTVTYVSGGIGQDEAQAFAAAARQYPLTLEFVIKHTPRAEYTANVHITIIDAQGQRLLDTRSDSPFLLAKLPAGGGHGDGEAPGADADQDCARGHA